MALDNLLPCLSMPMSNVQIRGWTCPVCQFKGEVVLDPKLDLKSSSEIYVFVEDPTKSLVSLNPNTSPSDHQGQLSSSHESSHEEGNTNFSGVNHKLESSPTT
jgi:hypothetical protein